MDFLKTLMLYMSLTFAGAMQSAPTPEITLEPTVTPYVVVSVNPIATETPAAAITATISTLQPTETPTAEPTAAPEPTITPNKAYKVIKFGQQNNNVKKMQQRLIELGYLEEGDDDGAFGYQTRRAVIAFQKANGLSADGTPGAATLTHLYEDPDVKENPDRTTPTPEPTGTPEPTIAPPDAQEAQTTEVPILREELSQARIVYNDAALTLYRQQDGVTVSANPRVYQLEDGRIQLSLTDLTDCIEDWSLTMDGSLISLNAAGYVVTLLPIGDQYSCMVDGQSVALAEGDVAVVADDPCVTADFLQKALGASVTWEAEESALLLRLQPKEQATD